ncbi:hypothetical protein [Teredinibacter haidensis]|uniref:hypothetical protein n=1 Tax=Teredinibacter haidensis TaxID=2731755 RepID=UPI000948FE31|nr:hypothetical protein [Teredinibacter haidensis]
MSDQNDFDNHLAAVQAIPSEALKTCPMPIGIYAQEAENLFHWATHDSETLIGSGLNRSDIDALAVRVGVLREAEARWQTEYRSQKDAEVMWANESPKAFDLRDDLLRSFRYAFRKDDNLLKRVSKIEEGKSNADMVQDLSTLAVLGRENTTLLDVIQFDRSKLDAAANTADTIAQLLAKVNGDRLSGNDGRGLRDKAYVYLKETVDEVRACGKYVFHDNDVRLSGYSSAYIHRKNRTSSKKNKAVEAES